MDSSSAETKASSSTKNPTDCDVKTEAKSKIQPEDQPIVTFVANQKFRAASANPMAGRTALLQGFLFRFNRTKHTVMGTRHYWRCKHCPARITTAAEGNRCVSALPTHDMQVGC